MYLKDFIEKYGDKKIKLFIDMDGVIVDYVVGSTADFDKRRPLQTSLKKLEEISNMPNVELFILSVTRMDIGSEQKNWWLDQYAPFFKKENRMILSRESNEFKSSAELKTDFFKNFERDGSLLIFIDDDPLVLKSVLDNVKDVIPLKDTALVD